jgi:hypothetical protein
MIITDKVKLAYLANLMVPSLFGMLIGQGFFNQDRPYGIPIGIFILSVWLLIISRKPSITCLRMYKGLVVTAWMQFFPLVHIVIGSGVVFGTMAIWEPDHDDPIGTNIFLFIVTVLFGVMLSLFALFLGYIRDDPLKDEKFG